MFIGEGPGFNEDQQARPFVGRAGQLLEELLASIPMRREDVFITNVVKCRPPENREPAPEEVAACAPFLESQIRLLNPRVIVTLGRHSLARFFPDSRISNDHGRVLVWRGRVVLPLYHPAAALRSSSIRAVLEADFRRLPDAVVASLRLAPGAGAPERASEAGAAANPPLPDRSGTTAHDSRRPTADSRPQLPLF
jgi:DNA polymerase